jgi:hypothetical protein
LFSGGLDANCSYIRIRDKKPLLFNIQGWYNKISDTNEAAIADIRDINAFAEREALNFSYAKSNFALLVNFYLWEQNIQPRFGYSYWYGFQHSMSFITIAMPIAYKYGVKNIYIASSIPMGIPTKCASHVTTDSEFRYAGIGRCIHDGTELTRQDKIRTLVTFQRECGINYQVRVCSFNDKNCCECVKCFRTVLGLVAEVVDVKNFGFFITKTLKEHWADVMYKRAMYMDFDHEKELHYPHIILRMNENYDKMTDEQREFVDWFISFDFDKAKKDCLHRYYRNNWHIILKSKFHTAWELVVGLKWNLVRERILDTLKALK